LKKLFRTVLFLGALFPFHAAFALCPPVPNLDQWLQSHPNYSQMILWEFLDPSSAAQDTPFEKSIVNFSKASMVSPNKRLSAWQTVRRQSLLARPSAGRVPSYVVSDSQPPKPLTKLGTLSWPQWGETYKNRIQKYFADYWTWNCQAWDAIDAGDSSEGLSVLFNTAQDPDPNPVTHPPTLLSLKGLPGVRAVSEEDAFGLYARILAWRLVLELSGKLPWSLADLATVELKQILDGRTLFSSVNGEAYAVNTIDMPAPPLIVFSFLVKNDILGKDRRETISRLLNWESNLFHAALGGLKTEYSAWYVYYQYEGPPPIMKIINGTHETTETETDPKKRHWTLGCGVTAGFNQLVLAGVNIPAFV
jgi:hypothetical protein